MGKSPEMERAMVGEGGSAVGVGDGEAAVGRHLEGGRAGERRREGRLSSDGGGEVG